MPWYSKYLSVLEKPFTDAPQEIVKEVHENLKKFRSENPIASVVVIAHNEEKRLLSCLWSLSENVCTYPIEIIGVNNDSTDQTASVFGVLGIPWFMEEKKSCGYARQRGLINAKGKYYICIDADTFYPPDYFQIMIDRLQSPGVVGVYTLLGFIPDGKSSWLGIRIYGTLRDMNIWALSHKRPELAVRGSAFAYMAQYGREIGYRVDIKYGEDGSMVLGLKKYGTVKLIINRKARVKTSPNTFNKQGSLLNKFIKKSFYSFKNTKRYFTKREVYPDLDSNLITPPLKDVVK